MWNANESIVDVLYLAVLLFLNILLILYFWISGYFYVANTPYTDIL